MNSQVQQNDSTLEIIFSSLIAFFLLVAGTGAALYNMFNRMA